MSTRFNELLKLSRTPRLRELADTDARATESLISPLRGALAHLLEFPEFARKLEPHLESLTAIFDELESVELPKNSAAKVLNSKDGDNDGQKVSVAEGGFDFAGRPVPRKITEDQSQRFAHSLR